MDFNSILKNYSTPFYVFDFDKTKERVRNIQAKLPSNTELCYAIKANAFLLYALKDISGLLFEVCSEGELQICKKLKISPDQIVFSGVMKNQKMLQDAVSYGVKTITIESLSHLNDLIKVLPNDTEQDVIVRISSGNQFGMSVDDFYKCYEIILLKKNIHIKGIHYFSGTQKKISKINEEMLFVENLVDEIKNKSDLDEIYIEYGPGLSFDYFGEDYSENYSDLNELSSLINKSKYKFVIELGRYIASPCGEYFTKVCDKKKNNNINYLILDGGINHINYYGQIMGMKIPPFEVIKMTNSCYDETDYCVCGSLCTVADVITKKVPIKNVEIGDLLKFKNIGAYSITEGIFLFLSHDLPLVFGKNQNDYKLLRDLETTYKLNI